MNMQLAAEFPQMMIIRPNSDRLGYIRDQRDHYRRQIEDISSVRETLARWAGHVER